jgi:hypothetical protein
MTELGDCHPNLVGTGRGRRGRGRVPFARRGGQALSSRMGRDSIHPRCFCKSGKQRACEIRKMKECTIAGKQWAYKFGFCAKVRIDRRGRKTTWEGVYPRCDGKSAEGIERKRVVRAPSAKRVRNRLEVKELNGVEELKDDEWARSSRGVAETFGAQCKQTRGMLPCG